MASSAPVASSTSPSSGAGSPPSAAPSPVAAAAGAAAPPAGRAGLSGTAYPSAESRRERLCSSFLLQRTFMFSPRARHVTTTSGATAVAA